MGTQFAAMQLGQFAYAGRGTPAAVRPRPPPFRGNGRWSWLDNDMLAEVLSHLDDRQLARLANVDRRTLKLARAAIQRVLGLSARVRRARTPLHFVRAERVRALS